MASRSWRSSRPRTGGGRSRAREEAARDRPPRRRRLSARPHAAGLRAGDRHRAPTTSSPTSCRPRTAYLIARHEPNIIATTDVAEPPGVRVAAARRDGRRRAPRTASSPPTSRCKEIKTLRAVQPLRRAPAALQRQVQDPDVRRGPRPASSASRAPAAPDDRGLSRDQAPDVPRAARAAARGASWSPRSSGTASTTRARRCSSSRFEQFNLKKLNKMTPVPLVQLVDANDVNPDGSLDYTAPFDRPYDWTVSGDPKLLARTFGFFATNAGLRGDLHLRRRASARGSATSSARRRSTSTATARSATRTATA